MNEKLIEHYKKNDPFSSSKLSTSIWGSVLTYVIIVYLGIKMINSNDTVCGVTLIAAVTIADLIICLLLLFSRSCRKAINHFLFFLITINMLFGASALFAVEGGNVLCLAVIWIVAAGLSGLTVVWTERRVLREKFKYGKISPALSRGLTVFSVLICPFLSFGLVRMIEKINMTVFVIGVITVVLAYLAGSLAILGARKAWHLSKI